MGQVVKVFYIQRAGDDGADALVGDFSGGGGGYADQEFFDGGIFDVFEDLLHGFRYGGSRGSGQIVSAAQVGGDGPGGYVHKYTLYSDLNRYSNGWNKKPYL